MRGLSLLVAALLSTAQPSPAQRDAALAGKGITRALAAGAITPTDAAAYRASVARVAPDAPAAPRRRVAQRPARRRRTLARLHDATARARPLLDARRKRGLARRSPAAAVRNGRDRSGRRRLPLLPRPRARVPSARRVRA